MFKRIVVATDMSSFAGRAEARAAMMAHELGCESLDLLHVVDRLALESLRTLTSPLDAERRLMESSRTRLDEIKQSISARYGIQVATLTLNVGRAHTEIVRYAQLLDASLLVLGAHGGGFVKGMMIGSIAEKVLDTVTCPLLIVREEPRTPYRRILLGVDFSPSSRDQLEFARKIAPAADPVVVHAFEIPFEQALHFAGIGNQEMNLYRAEMKAARQHEMDRLLAGFGKTGGQTQYAVESGGASAVISRKAEELDTELIIIGRQGRSAGERGLPGATARKVIQGARCDVLVLP